MKKALLCVMLTLIISCSVSQNEGTTQHKADENDEIVLPTSVTSADKFDTGTHKSISSIAAEKMGLSSARISVITEASVLPDEYQSGLSNLYNQQWSHAYLISSWGSWMWGDADEDYHDNIEGGDDSYDGKSASVYYEADDQENGDWYLGYAMHYIEDVNFCLHSTFPNGLTMLTKHFAFEEWMENNLTSGYNLLAAAEADDSYYEVTDLKSALKAAAKGSCYWTSDVGKNAWKAYVACGYPTETGTGSEELANAAKVMIVRAARYAKGTIKYTLDKYSQWEDQY